MDHALVRIKPLPNFIRTPVYGTVNAAGFDLYAAQDHEFYRGETYLMPLGFAAEIDPDYHGRIEARSGMASKDLVVLTGVVDADYRGEWHAILHFAYKHVIVGDGCQSAPPTIRVKRGDRVAQCVLRRTVRASFELVDNLSATGRGAGGFGSTGTR